MLSSFRSYTTYDQLKIQILTLLDPEPSNAGTDIQQYYLRTMKNISFFGWFDMHGRVEHRTTAFSLRSCTNERAIRIIETLENILNSDDTRAAEVVFSLLQLKNSRGKSIDHLCMYYAGKEAVEKYFQLLARLYEHGISKDKILTLKETLYCSYAMYALQIAHFFIDSEATNKSNILKLLLEPEGLPVTIKQAAELEKREDFINYCQDYFNIVRALATQSGLKASEIMTLLHIRMNSDTSFTLIEFINEEKLPLTQEFNNLMATLIVRALSTEKDIDAMAFKSYKEIVRDYLCQLPTQMPSDRTCKKELLIKAQNRHNGLGDFFHIKRGWREPDVTRGTLHKINQQYTKIVAAEARENKEAEDRANFHSKLDLPESTGTVSKYGSWSRSAPLSKQSTHRRNYGSLNDDHSPARANFKKI